MPGQEVKMGPFSKGLHNSSGSGEFIDDAELFDLVNLEVDLDGSLANRPAILTTTPGGIATRFKIIGTFFPSGGQRYLVVSYGTSFGTTGLYNIAANSITVSRAIKSNDSVQYNNNCYIVPASDATAGTGGYWNSAVTPAWTASTNMPNGDCAVIFKDRMCISAGLAAPSISDSFVYYSCLLHPETWVGDPTPPAGDVKTNDAGNFSVEQGNGQRAISIIVMNNDLVVFKEHSTFRWTFSSDPTKGDLSKISSTIGTPTINCVVSFDNNNLYLLHDNSVYELYNYSFTDLSNTIRMDPVVDSDIYSDSNYGLTIFRTRLFVRYFNQLYVFSLQTGRWSRWSSVRKFITLTELPNPQGQDVAYASSISISAPNLLLSIVDDRTTNVGTVENFNCSIITKTYDFDISWAFKVMFWWGMTIATLGQTTVVANVPNATFNYTWNELAAIYPSWQTAKDAGIKWSNNPPTIANSSYPAEKGSFARKFLKFNKKVRFRQIFFTVTTNVVNNFSAGDSCVRIYDMTAFVNQKETVVARTT